MASRQVHIWFPSDLAPGPPCAMQPSMQSLPAEIARDFFRKFHGICSSWTLPTVGPWKNPPIIEFLASMGLGGSSFSSFSPGADCKTTEFPRRSQVNHQISRRCFMYWIFLWCPHTSPSRHCSNNVNKRSWNVVPPPPALESKFSGTSTCYKCCAVMFLTHNQIAQAFRNTRKFQQTANTCSMDSEFWCD